MKVLENVKNGSRSPIEILDEAIPDIPAIMMEQTSHSVWVNSKALEKAGINESTPNENGGVIWMGKGIHLCLLNSYLLIFSFL